MILRVVSQQTILGWEFFSSFSKILIFSKQKFLLIPFLIPTSERMSWKIVLTLKIDQNEQHTIMQVHNI